MNFNNDPDNTIVIPSVDGFGWGYYEPEAISKWNGGDYYIWQNGGHDYVPPEVVAPLWMFISDDKCHFSISDQFNFDPNAYGGCELGLDTVKVTFVARPEVSITLRRVDSFDGVIMSPNAIEKWTDGEHFYVWKERDADAF